MKAVLWIRDILVRIRIPMTYGSGTGSRSWFICQWLTGSQQRVSFFQRFFCYFLKVHSHKVYSLNIRSHNKSQNSINQGFFTFNACYGRIRINKYHKWRIRMSQKLTDPDPQHWKWSSLLKRNDNQLERKYGNKITSIYANKTKYPAIWRTTEMTLCFSSSISLR